MEQTDSDVHTRGETEGRACATLHPRLSGHTLALPVIQGAPERLAGEGSGVFAMVQQHLTIDNHIVYLYSTLRYVHLPTHELIEKMVMSAALPWERKPRP
jgi:hypothetical protein